MPVPASASDAAVNTALAVLASIAAAVVVVLGLASTGGPAADRRPAPRRGRAAGGGARSSRRSSRWSPWPWGTRPPETAAFVGYLAGVVLVPVAGGALGPHRADPVGRDRAGGGRPRGGRETVGRLVELWMNPPWLIRKATIFAPLDGPLDGPLGGPAGAETDPEATAAGPGRVLVALYALFALAAGARAAVQLATQYSEAPLAYLLSALWPWSTWWRRSAWCAAAAAAGARPRSRARWSWWACSPSARCP